VKRLAVALVVFAAIAAPALASSYPTHVAVSLTRIPGNTCCPTYTRAAVSAKGVLTTATMERGGAWKVQSRRKLTATELKRLRAELARFNPATLKPNNSAGCNGAPIGDVGGDDLRVGSHESSCPPKSASRLIGVLRAWLPKS
jgi:hypothetical protein